MHPFRRLLERVRFDFDFLFLVPVCTLLAILGFLTSRAATVGTSNILLLLGFGLHLTVVLVLITATTEVDAILKDVLEIVHHSSLFTIHYSLFPS